MLVCNFVRKSESSTRNMNSKDLLRNFIGNYDPPISKTLDTYNLSRTHKMPLQKSITPDHSSEHRPLMGDLLTSTFYKSRNTLTKIHIHEEAARYLARGFHTAFYSINS